MQLDPLTNPVIVGLVLHVLAMAYFSVTLVVPSYGLKYYSNVLKVNNESCIFYKELPLEVCSIFLKFV